MAPLHSRATMLPSSTETTPSPPSLDQFCARRYCRTLPVASGSGPTPNFSGVRRLRCDATAQSAERTSRYTSCPSLGVPGVIAHQGGVKLSSAPAQRGRRGRPRSIPVMRLWVRNRSPLLPLRWLASPSTNTVRSSAGQGRERSGPPPRPGRGDHPSRGALEIAVRR